jgi:hypothetical protein
MPLDLNLELIQNLDRTTEQRNLRCRVAPSGNPTPGGSALVIVEVDESVAAQAARHVEDLNLGPAALGSHADHFGVLRVEVRLHIGTVPPLLLVGELGVGERREVHPHLAAAVVGHNDNRDSPVLRELLGYQAEERVDKAVGK